MISMLSVIAYETIIINFPDGENWEKAYYKKVGNEALLQYVPYGETSDTWSRSIVVHSYKDRDDRINTFATNNLRRMQLANPTTKYKTIKMSQNDAMFTRCTEKYKNVDAQCEFYKITKVHQGIVSVHYMNKDKENFMNNYTLWHEIIRNTKFLNSYYRNERTFNKSIYFELW